MSERQDRNRISLWRKFDRQGKQPVAKGDGVVGENDFRVSASMWPSKSGKKQDGSPWQMWSVSIQPHKEEKRTLMAIPAGLVGEVEKLLAEHAADTTGGEGTDGDLAEDHENLPF